MCTSILLLYVNAPVSCHGTFNHSTRSTYHSTASKPDLNFTSQRLFLHASLSNTLSTSEGVITGERVIRASLE